MFGSIASDEGIIDARYAPLCDGTFESVATTGVKEARRAGKPSSALAISNNAAIATLVATRETFIRRRVVLSKARFPCVRA
jgi:hypothetical protein